jgi:hypothetical protein
MADLIQTVMNALPANAGATIASLTGQTPAAASAGVATAVPALLAGALQKSSTAAGASDLLGLVRQVTAAGNPLDQVSALLSDPGARSSYLSQGENLAGSILGGGTDSVARLIGSTQNIGGGAASTILAFVAPLVMGAIGRLIGSSPTPSGLQSVLAGERSNIARALPGGLGSMFGLGSAASAAVGAAEGASVWSRNWHWLLVALALIFVALFGLRYCSNQQVNLPHVSLTLPGGGSIDVVEGTIGYGVAKFLESSDPPPKTFVFDNLNFDTASNKLTRESAPTVATLVAILKAYPNVHVRIVGYTDNQGDPSANLKLSDARAASVKEDLVAGGIAADRIDTAGMGQDNPIADNGTEEGRAKNRRTELVIVSK